MADLLNGIKGKTWRNQNVDIVGGEAKEVYFRDTEPHVLQIRNTTANVLYVGYVPTVSSTNYQIQVQPYSTEVFSSPVAMNNIFLLCASSGSIDVNSAEAYSLSPNDLNKTAVVVLSNVTATNVSIDDGADITQGYKGDNANDDYTLSDTVIAFIKGILKVIKNRLPSALTSGGGVKVGVVDSLPAGSNVVGGVTIADGSDATQGAKSDTANTDDSTSGSVIAFLKGLLNVVKARIPSALTSGGGIKVGVVDSLPAGTNVVGAVNVNDANILRGSTSVDIKSVTMTSANTEYSYALTGNLRKLTLAVEDGDASITWTASFTTGKVTGSSDRLKLYGYERYSEDDLYLTVGMVYFACSGAGKKMIVTAWYN